MAFVLIFL